jgi:hypothetical protein
MKARVDELRSELQKMGGNALLDPSAPSSAGGTSDQLYPSIRKLPLLGVRWLDLYRETKIQETIFQLLTEQCEIARVEEAKEIPTVKVFDAPNLPERKSFPPRTLIAILGMVLSFVAGILWVLAKASWKEMDPRDPRKQFGLEVGSAIYRTCQQWGQKLPFLRNIIERWKRRQSSPDLT